MKAAQGITTDTCETKRTTSGQRWMKSLRWRALLTPICISLIRPSLLMAGPQVHVRDICCSITADMDI